MKKNVFISSTYSDLKNYRRRVWDLLEKYDVSLIGMEKFGARKEAPLVTCLAEVEQSDIFICIVAMKLGSIDSKTEKSFTQLEYEKAYSLEKDILIYMANEKDLKFSVEEIDFGEKKEKLDAFKTTLKNRHTVDFYSSEDELAQKLERRFNELLTKKEQEQVEESNEYERSKHIIEKFFVVPKLYSSKEIKLDINFEDEPFPASKSICSTFNFEYGKTIGINFSLLQPSITIDFPKQIFVTSDNVDKYFELGNKKNVKVIAKLEFSETKVKEVKANFLKQEYYEVSGVQLALTSSFEPLIGKRRIVEPEGQVIIHLSEFL